MAAPSSGTDALLDVSHSHFVKKTCASFVQWRPWQQRILLCGVTNRCSSHHLERLSSALEPVFHRDFVAALTGVYPSAPLRRRPRPKEPPPPPPRRSDRSFLLRRSKTWTLLTNPKQSEDKPKRRRESESLAWTIRRSVDWKEEIVERSLSLEKISLPPLPLRGRADHDHLPSYAASRTSSDALDVESDEYFSPTNVWKTRSRWDSGAVAMNSYFVDPNRRRLAEHFKLQIREMWKWIESCSEVHRAQVLQALLKCCDEEQTTFFVQCLFQRLHDLTNVDSLPDAILLVIFSHLDAASVYRCGHVCQRWRTLSLISRQWKTRIHQLGTARGIHNLTKALEDAGKGRQVDWRKAYEEMSLFYQNQTSTDDEETLGKHQSTNTDEEEEEEEEPLDVDPSELDLRTLVLIGKIKGVTQSSAVAEDYGSRRLTRGFESFGRLSPATGDNARGDDAEVKRRLFGSAAQRRREAAAAAAAVGLTAVDFSIDVKSQDVVALPNSKRKSKSKARRREKPKVVSVALDVRPVEKASSIRTGASLLLQLAGIFVADGEELSDGEDMIDVRNVRLLQGHLDAVVCAQLDTRRIMTGSLDRTLRVWDIRSGREVAVLCGHKGGVRCVQFDDEKIVTGSWDTTCVVWDVSRFSELRTLWGHRGCVSCMKLLQDCLVTGSHDCTLRVWSTVTWLCERVIVAHDTYVNCLDYDGQWIVSGSADKTLKIWDVKSGECLHVLRGHKSAVISCRMRVDLIISGSVNGDVRLWDASSGDSVADVPAAHKGPVHAVAVSDSHFFTGGSDNQVKEWSLVSGSCVRSLQGHTGSVQALEVTNTRLVTCSDDWTVRVWETNAPAFLVGAMHNVEHTENIAIKRLVAKIE